MKLADFLNIHAGETAWMFGKGPSLSGYDFSKAGPIRCAINDVAGYVPGVKYCFANDGVAKWADVYCQDHTLFQPVRCMREYDSLKPGAVDCDVVTYDDAHNDVRLFLSRQEIAEMPTIRRGTLGSAVQILHIMGIRHIHMVGIDGGGTHAECHKWRTRLRNDHAKDYNAIRSAAIDACAIMGITLTFEGGNKMEPNGKIYVRFIKNAFCKGEPYSQGEIAGFAPLVAQSLVNCRAAERFAPPENRDVVIETASMDVEKIAETAVMPIGKKRGRKPKN